MKLTVKNINVDKEKLRYGFLSYFLFLFHPISAIFTSMLLGKLLSRWSLIFLIALLWGVAGYYYEPLPDTDLNTYYTHYETGNMFVVEKTDRNADIDAFVLLLFSTLSSLGASSHYIGAVSGFIFGLLLTLIASYWEKLLKGKLYFFFIFISLVLSNYLLDFTGLRYANGVLLFILAIVFQNRGKSKWAIYLSLMACCFHFSLLPLVILFGFSQLAPRKAVYILSSILFLLSLFFLPIMEVLKDKLYNYGLVGMGIAYKIDVYIFSDYGDETLYAGSRFWPIQKILSFIMSFFLLIIYRREMATLRMKIIPFLIILLSYLCFIFFSKQMFFRSLLVNNYLACLLVLYLFQIQMGLYKRLGLFLFMSLFLLCGIFASLSGLEFMSLFFSPEMLKYNYIKLFI